jgi:drug/metabolite transporter (DMT)-like permease
MRPTAGRCAGTIAKRNGAHCRRRLALAGFSRHPFESEISSHRRSLPALHGLPGIAAAHPGPNPVNAAERSNWRIALAGILLAVGCFSALDSLTKLVGTLVPLVVVIWSRYLFLFVVTGTVQMRQRGRAAWRTGHLGLQWLRGVCIVSCSSFAYLSLKHMMVGEFTAVVALTPLVITAAAALVLRERVSVWRWACVLGGFTGALIVIRPHGSDFNWSLLYPLGTVATNAAYQVLTSRLARDESPGSMQLYTGLVGVVTMSVALPFCWSGWPGWGASALLLLIGVLSLLGHQCLIQAYGRAPASRLTPFLYAQIGFSLVMGWLLFDQLPDGWACAGVGLIAACGVAGTWLAGREPAPARPTRLTPQAA